MDAIHDPLGRDQHPLPQHCTLGVQCRQLCFCHCDKWQSLSGLPTECACHESSFTEGSLALGNSCFQSYGLGAGATCLVSQSDESNI